MSRRWSREPRHKRWEKSYKDPGLIPTDLPPEASDARWYRLLAWIAPSFKITKRASWQWHRTRMRGSERAARLWLAVAVTTLWLLSVGGVAEDDVPESTKYRNVACDVTESTRDVHLTTLGKILQRLKPMAHANYVTTYPSWALMAFTDWVLPSLHRLTGDGLLTREWLDSCQPGESGATRLRLFPGSLFLLWLDALGVVHGEDHALVAAAIECLHNASLHHDDVLDAHDSRRGVDTIRALSGAPGAVLAGDGLIGAAMRSLTLLERLDTRVMLTSLGQAWSRMNRGQLMDQPEVWRNVPGENLETHWDRMTRDKLAIGNVAAPLAAVCAGKHDLIDQLCAIHEEFSVVSQILNDIGDMQGWAGFHTLAPCKRKQGHEAELKPTIATIWQARVTSLDSDKRALDLVVLARQRVSGLTERALERLYAIECQTDAQEVLLDFFTRPLTEFDRVIAEGWAG